MPKTPRSAAKKAARPPTRQPADKVLYQAIVNPTPENVDAALSHEDLQEALEGITRTDLKKISTVVAKLDEDDKQKVRKVLAASRARTVC